MRGLLSTGLVLAAASRFAGGQSASAQESRPIAETIRVKQVDEGYRRLPLNILVMPSDIAPDLPVLSLPRSEDAQSSIRLVGGQEPILPPSLEPAVPAMGNSLVIPSIEVAAPSNRRQVNEPSLLPNLEDPGNTPAKDAFAIPEMPALSPPSEPGMNARVHAAPTLIPVSAKITTAVEADRRELDIPSDGRRTGPRVIEKSRRAFWDRNYDPAKDCDRDACVEGQTVVLDRNPRSHWWLEADYLHWYTKSGRTPTLLFGGYPSVLSTPDNPQLGRTFPLYSSLDRENRVTPGVRLSVGTWFEPCYRWGLEATTTAIFDRGETRNYSSPGDLYLLRPIVDSSTNLPSLVQLAGGGTVSGSMRIETYQRLVGEEIHFLYALRDMPQGGNSLTSLNLLFGYRHLQFREHLNLGGQSEDLLRGNSFLSNDHFATWSDFHSGQLGLKGTYQTSKWTLDVSGKIALGGATQNVVIRGESAISSPLFGTQTRPVGLLAQSSNIGEYQRQKLVYAPEVGARLSYQFAPNVVGSVGYNFLYVSSVVRAADQIDSTVNFSGSGPARPTFRWKDDDLWAQGITLGLTLQY